MRTSELVEYVIASIGGLLLKLRFGCALLALLLVAQGCGVGQQRAYVPHAAPDKVSSGRATIIIPLPPIRPKGAPVDWSTGMLSTPTNSAKLKIGKRTIGPISLTASNPHCISATKGLTCTIIATFKPEQGKTILVQTYATGVKAPLATGAITANVYPGRNTLSVQMAGITHKLKVILSPNTLHHGQYSLDKIYVEKLDAAHAEIPGNQTLGPLGNGFQIDLAFSGFYMGSESGYEGHYYYYGNDFNGVLPYDGVATGTETITATADGQGKIDIPKATATATVVPGVTDLAPFAFGITVPAKVEGYSVPTIAQFPLTVSGSNPPPVRQFIKSYLEFYQINASSSADTAAWPVYGEDSSGDFWVGNVHLSNSLSILGTVTLPSNVRYASGVDSKGHLYGWDSQQGECALYEFPNHYGSVKPIREIDGPCGQRIVIDASGNIYDAGQFNDSSPAYGVQEYAPTGGSGAIAPIRQMPMPSSGDFLYGNGFLGLDVDDAGNVYAAAETFDARETKTGQIYKFAPGHTTGTLQLGGLQVLGFVVDGAGDIYAQVPTTKYLISEIEEFAPVATTPMRTISGTNSYGMPILVPR
ncbi:MAG TPA: hypothetical protein VFE36_06000 [Candidatus Baltobacteraceae bacterium]|jgi:hypothetical protein|nr:hypothetical protein [Candidatus Baltobacteraceae bacterium]